MGAIPNRELQLSRAASTGCDNRNCAPDSRTPIDMLLIVLLRIYASDNAIGEFYTHQD